MRKIIAVAALAAALLVGAAGVASAQGANGVEAPAVVTLSNF